MTTPTGRNQMSSPEMQNIPGTIADRLEKEFARIFRMSTGKLPIGTGDALTMTRDNQMLLDQLQVFCPAARIPVEEFLAHADIDHEQDIGLLERAVHILLAHLIEHDKALQSLTPGGSEYVNDRQRCLAVNKATIVHQAKVIKALQDQFASFAWSPAANTHWSDPVGTLWRQPDGTFVATVDHSDHVMKLPVVKP